MFTPTEEQWKSSNRIRSVDLDDDRMHPAVAELACKIVNKAKSEIVVPPPAQVQSQGQGEGMVDAAAPVGADAAAAAAATPAPPPGSGSVVRLSDFPGYSQEQFDAAMNSMDMCFVMDITGSMADYIEAAKTQVGAIVDQLRQQYAGVTIRLAFVGYRDIKDRTRFEVLQFTTNPEAFRNFCASLTAAGGDDFPEDLAGGLNLSLQLKWHSVTRALYIITDAPCHGREFSDPERASMDDFPGGDPFGLQPKLLLEQLRDMNVDVSFGEITRHTAVMVSAFRAFYNRPELGIDMTTFSLAVCDDQVRSAALLPSYASAVGVFPDLPPSAPPLAPRCTPHSGSGSGSGAPPPAYAAVVSDRPKVEGEMRGEGVARGVARTVPRPAGGPTRSVWRRVTHGSSRGSDDDDDEMEVSSRWEVDGDLVIPSSAPAPLSSFSGSAAPKRSLTNSKFLEEVSSSAMRSITKSMARRGVTRPGPEPEPAEAKGDSRGAPGVELGEAAVEPGVAVSLAPSAAFATVVSAGGSDAPPPSLSSDAHR